MAEGLATAASIHAATGFAVAVAFDAGNLTPVTASLRARFPQAQIVVCADDDTGTEGNPGLTKATEAARLSGAALAVPTSGVERPAGVTDFNDLHLLRGLAAVRERVEEAVAAPGVPPPSAATDTPTTRRLRAGLEPLDQREARQAAEPASRHQAAAAETDAAVGKGPAGRSQATVLVDLALAAGVELWHTPSGDPYVTIDVAGHLNGSGPRGQGFLQRDMQLAGRRPEAELGVYRSPTPSSPTGRQTDPG